MINDIELLFRDQRLAVVWKILASKHLSFNRRLNTVDTVTLPSFEFIFSARSSPLDDHVGIAFDRQLFAPHRISWSSDLD